MECVRRELTYELEKKREKLHLLRGLGKILLDIDKAIHIVRETEKESDVVPRLMDGFSIDEIQAEYIAEIRLRHLNREYILERIHEIESLQKDITELEDTIRDELRIKAIIIKQLTEIKKKYGKPRKTQLIQADEIVEVPEEEPVERYDVHVTLTKEGYFKKITRQSLRMADEHKLKDGDTVVQSVESHNTANLLFFTNMCRVYKASASDFDDTKASVLGDFVAAKLGMDTDEVPRYMAVTDDYKGFMMFFMENGRVAKVSMSAYQTKLNRKKLIKACCDKFGIVAFDYAHDECEYLMRSTGGRMVLLPSALLAEKTTKDTQGVVVMTQKRGQRLESAQVYTEGMLAKPHRYRPKTLPSAGQLMSAEERAEQLSFD